MARYSDKREENFEIKYLRKVWSDVDEQIELPQSLTGKELLSKLDGVKQIEVPSRTREIRFSPRIFTLQSGLTYAAAFVLIVLLSYAVGRSDVDIIEGTIPIEATEAAEVEIMADNDLDSGGEAEPRVDNAVPADDVQPDDPAVQESPLVPAVGGPGESVLLGDIDGYSYTYRPNDPTDPDKDGYPITLSVMNAESQELIYQIDVPDLQSVSSYYISGNHLALIGPAGSGSVVRVYNTETTQEQLVVVQPGSYQESRIYNDMIHILSLVDSSAGLECEVEALPGGNSDVTCVITAVNLLSGAEYAQRGFTGVDGDISLYNLHAYVSYQGEVTEENEDGQYVAQIRLQGLDMELTAVAE